MMLNGVADSREVKLSVKDVVLRRPTGKFILRCDSNFISLSCFKV